MPLQADYHALLQIIGRHDIRGPLPILHVLLAAHVVERPVELGQQLGTIVLVGYIAVCVCLVVEYAAPAFEKRVFRSETSRLQRIEHLHKALRLRLGRYGVVASAYPHQLAVLRGIKPRYGCGRLFAVLRGEQRPVILFGEIVRYRPIQDDIGVLPCDRCGRRSAILLFRLAAFAQMLDYPLLLYRTDALR